jgi:catechol 2,3-dioxygenase-like lactoylglutathione lyase family enzyme
MIKARAINHTALRITDPKRAQDFYTKVLGLKVVPFPAMTDATRKFGASLTAAAGTPAPTGGLWVEAPDGKQLHLIAAPVASGKINPFGPHIAIEVEDIVEARRSLEGQGIEYLAAPEGMPFAQLWVLDPDGSTIELWASRQVGHAH